MIFYLAVGTLFTIYALDLLVLVVISLFAKAHEVRVLAGPGGCSCGSKKDLEKVDGGSAGTGDDATSGETCIIPATLTKIHKISGVEVKAEVLPNPTEEDGLEGGGSSADVSPSLPPPPVAPSTPPAGSTVRLSLYQRPLRMYRLPGSASPCSNESPGPGSPAVQDENRQDPYMPNPPDASSWEREYSPAPDLSASDIYPSDVPTNSLELSPADSEEKDDMEKCKISEPLPEEQIEVEKVWPKVLIQLPMFNEEAHAGVVIERICKIRWPRDRLLVQVSFVGIYLHHSAGGHPNSDVHLLSGVLDDSTKKHVRDMVDESALVAIEAGHPVQVLRRTNREGYKAGAMVDGLVHLEGQGFEFVAIFDADFIPPANFLEETVAPLVADDRKAFIQSRWLCSPDSFLTWVQKVNLGFHFDVEQRARAYMDWFFNFNGTAGVWRIKAIEDAGGWQCDTVVEDMDLSLRCYLKGWSGGYVSHVDNPNELPSSLSAYKTQQFRWLSGPMQILAKSYKNIWTSTDISFVKRLNCYWFFTRYLLFATVTLCVVAVPPVILWLDKWEWEWPQIFFLVSINFALAVYLYVTPFSIAYLLFSVAIGYFKTWAMLSGLVGSEKSKKWKVTKKLGSGQEGGGFSLKDIHKPYALELCLSIYYFAMGSVACAAYHNWMIGGYCILMGVIFVTLSFGDNYL